MTYFRDEQIPLLKPVRKKKIDWKKSQVFVKEHIGRAGRGVIKNVIGR